jgi:hypothetical protein
MTRPKDRVPNKPQEPQDEAEAPAPAAKADWPKFLKSSTSFGYTDPVTNIHYGPIVPVRIDAAPKAGSWLHSQMQAQLIVEA